jgi:chemotaxis response regulator CheB
MATSPARPKSEKTRRQLRRTCREKPSAPEVLNDPPDVRFPIVMVSASGGGPDAFTALLKGLPDDTGVGFVLIQHLEPTHESALARILARNILMPIREVVDGVATERNHVEAEALANDIFIHVTPFFRDPEYFQALRKQAFRHLRKRST